MSWPIYTETFLRVTAQGTWLWNVPAGHRAVVKAITVMALAAPPSNVWVIVGGVYTSYFTFQAAGTFREQSLLAVAYAGQKIEVLIGTAGTHVTVSGYLFSDSSGRHAAPGDVVHRSLDRPEHRPAAGG